MNIESSHWIAEEEERAAHSARRVREASERELEEVAGKSKRGELLSHRRIEFKPVPQEELVFLLERGRITTEDSDGEGATSIVEGNITNERGETETRLFRFRYERERFTWIKKEYGEGRADWQKVPCKDMDTDCVEKRVKTPGYEDLGLKPEMPTTLNNGNKEKSHSERGEES